MEGCGVSELAFTTHTIFFLSILMPIFVMLCVFLSIIDARILTLTRTSVSGRTDRGWRRSTEQDVQQDGMASCPITYSTDLLDGGIEDIRIKPLRPLLMTPVADENSAPLIEGPDDLLGCIMESLKISALDPKHTPRNPLSQRHPRDAAQSNTNIKPEIEADLTVVKWDGRISWALKGSSIFSDADEEFDAFNARSNMLVRQPYSKLWVFQYGLRYIPSLSDRDVYRTVRIEELSCETKLNQILPHIVGEIYCARLADTSSITGHKTAMVIFVTQKDAFKFVTAISNKTLVMPFGKIVPVHTPTYPMPADTERLIAAEGYTRTLGVFHTRPTIKMEITRVLTNPRFNYVLQLESINDGHAVGEVSVKMVSVKAAATVFEWLRNHPSLGKCHFRFLKQDGTPSDTNTALVDPDSQTADW
ncbi:hypothetical protein BJX76DRAFT_361693 [Aspergillus varians]